MKVAVLMVALATSINCAAHKENGQSYISLDLNFHQQIKSNIHKPEFVKSSSSKPPISNAYNLYIPESQVDVRTGELRFVAPIGYYNIYTESLKLELRYSSNMAINGNDDWKLGFGWYFNLPYIKYFIEDDTALYYPGDGSTMVIKNVTDGKAYIKYQLTDDYYLHYVAKRKELLIQRNGEKYIFRMPEKLNTGIGHIREYFSANMKSATFDWIYSVDTTTLTIKGADCGGSKFCGKIIQHRIGTTRYSTSVETYTTIATAGERLDKFICEIDTVVESTNSYVNTSKCTLHEGHAGTLEWRFVPKHSATSLQSRLIEKIIDERTGYEEEIEWYKDDLFYNEITACRVSKLLKKYGSNINLKFKITPQNTLMEYTYGTHSYLGSPDFAWKTGIYDDYLIDTMGVYNYDSIEKLHSSCIKHFFDHFHREYQTILYEECNNLSSEMEKVIIEYPCSYHQQDINFNSMVYKCKEHKHYLYPMNVTKVIYEHLKKSDNNVQEYKETTHYNYDNHGKIVKKIEPNGLITTIEYDQAHGDETNGALRVVKTVNVTAIVCNQVEIGKSCKVTMQNECDPWLGRGDVLNKWYPLLKKSSFFYPRGRKLILYKEVKYQRYTETDTKGKTQYQTTIYHNKDGTLDECWILYQYESSHYKNSTYKYIWKVIKHVQVKNKTDYFFISEQTVIDLPTGLTIGKYQVDDTRIITSYDIAGRIHSKEILGNEVEKSKKILYTDYQNADIPDKNRITIVNKGDKIITKLLLDNYLRTQEIQISKNYQNFYTTHIFEYNNRNQLSVQHEIVGAQQFKTQYKYNKLGKLIETIFPNRVREIIEYGVAFDGDKSLGLVERKYYQSKKLKSAVECVFLKYGTVHSKGLVLRKNKDVKVSCTNYKELSWMKNYTYNSLMKPMETKIFIQDGTVHYKRTYQYDVHGRLKKENRYNEKIDLESHLSYSYNNLDQETKITIFNALETDSWILGERMFDNIGRLQTETVAGIKTEYSYNSLSQMWSTWLRGVELEGIPPKYQNQRKIITKYDYFGNVKSRIASLHRPTLNRNSDLNAVHKAEVTLKIDYDDISRIIGYTILRSTKKLEKKFKYDDLLNSVNNVEVTINEEHPKSLATKMDPLGRVTHGKDFVGIEFSNTFNDKNQLSKVHYYNENRNRNYTLHIAYDGLGRLKSTNFLTDPKEKKGARTIYRYDYYGNLKRQKFFKNGKKITIIKYKYDNLDRLYEKETNGGGKGIMKSRILERYYYDGIKVTKYRCENMLTSNKDTKQEKWRCPQMTDGINSLRTTVRFQAFTYDFMGNIINSRIISDKTQILDMSYNYTHTVITRLLNVRFDFYEKGRKRMCRTYYHYDGGGNVIKSRINIPGQTYSYSMKNKYDAMDKCYFSNYLFGRVKTDNKISRSHDEDGSLYLYKHTHEHKILQNVNLFRDQNGALVSEGQIEGYGSYIYGGEKKVAFIGNGDKSEELNYFLDYTGSVSASVKGTNVERETFLPYGSCSRNSSLQRIGFQNMWTEDLRQIVDTKNGRLYDPATGRFLQLDPLSLFTNEKAINGYSYAMNSPILFGDSSGEQPMLLQPTAREFGRLSFRGQTLSMIPTYISSGIARSFRIAIGSRSISKAMIFNDVIRTQLGPSFHDFYSGVQKNKGSCGHYCMAGFVQSNKKTIADAKGFAHMSEDSSNNKAHAICAANMVEFLGNQKTLYGWNIRRPAMWTYRKGRLNLPTVKEYVENEIGSGFVHFNGIRYDEHVPDDVKLDTVEPPESTNHRTLLTWKRRFADQLRVYLEQKGRIHNWIDVTPRNNKISDGVGFYGNYEIMLYHNLKPNMG